MMTNIVQVIHSLHNLLTLKPATTSQIADAEIQLGVSFANEYKEYLSSFGAIMADGVELTGIAKSEHRNVVNLTKQEWELNCNVPHSMYVIENVGIDGIVIWQDVNGFVYQSVPFSNPKQIATSLVDYILNYIKNTNVQ